MNYDLKEEEAEIIDAFKYEMLMSGHKGFYSFYDNVTNGYLIYKEENYWVREFYEKGKCTQTKKYTNIYNLCLDILEELKIDDFYFKKCDLAVPRGTNVIISKSLDCPIDDIKQGIIVKSDFDKVQGERVYQVFGDDEKLYTGLYGLRIYGDICFRTIEDYIKDSEKELLDNKDSIDALIKRNWELSCTIEELKGNLDYQFGDSIWRK